MSGARLSRCVAQDAEARPKAKQLVQQLTKIEMDLRTQLKDAHNQLEEQRRLRLQQLQPSAQGSQNSSSPPLSPLPQQNHLPPVSLCLGWVKCRCLWVQGRRSLRLTSLRMPCASLCFSQR